MFLYRILHLCAFGLAMFIIVPAFAGSPSGDNRARKLYKEGLQLKKDGRLDEAQQRFIAAIAVDGAFAAAYIELAGIYRLQQQPEPAKQQLLILLEKSPEHPAALETLAGIFYEQKAYEDALTYAFRAQEQGCRKMHRIIGLSYSYLDHPAEAIPALENACREEPRKAELLCQVARLYAQQEDYKQSIRYYELSLQGDSTSPDVYYELGMMNFNMENYKTATGAFEQAARLGRPVDADLYLNLGMAHLKQAAYDDAIRNLLSALALRPKDVQVMTNLANAWYKKQDFKNAITQWNNILLQQPLNGFAMFMLGKSYICSGEIARGQAICDQALTLGER